MSMHAVVYDKVGSEMGFTIREMPIPAVGDDEVLYEVEAFGLNQADLLLIQGRHYVVQDLPIRLGYEGSGTVVAVGKNVKNFREGDKVTSMPNVDGPYSNAGTHALAQERFLTKRPAGYSAQEAAHLWMQTLTAYYPMAELFPIKPGDWVMITAATGGSGLGAIQMAKLLGARVIATTRSPERKGALLKQEGADHVIETYGSNLIDEVNDITSGKGVSLICDSIGGPYVNTYASTLAPQGILYVYGVLSNEDMSLPVLTLAHRGAGLYGYSLINELRKPGALERGRDFVLAALEAGKIKRPVIDRVFPFAEAAEAYQYLMNGTRGGKIIVSVK
ncbi:zinc-dependent alcohol dehydrogenase family protein [Emcibacter sp.]|uniref:zinc-dependent alcohol dehydrogenase family protein n=1 Tax=Emcibacter sp. TaxID=1979954 RepID=UPI002AA63390|nr:zinc-dependent alcohol dehydrogenase family protein [Emcibacter sp.]